MPVAGMIILSIWGKCRRIKHCRSGHVPTNVICPLGRDPTYQHLNQQKTEILLNLV